MGPPVSRGVVPGGDEPGGPLRGGPVRGVGPRRGCPHLRPSVGRGPPLFRRSRPTHGGGLLAIERGDLETAAEVTERILDMLGGGRPVFDYLAQLDRARIWAAGGHLDAALASLTPARAALHSDHSVLLAQADELEARFRLALGDPPRGVPSQPACRMIVASSSRRSSPSPSRTRREPPPFLATSPPRDRRSAPISNYGCYAALSPLSQRPRPPPGWYATRARSSTVMVTSRPFWTPLLRS